jgi:hypothetical protein
MKRVLCFSLVLAVMLVSCSRKLHRPASKAPVIQGSKDSKTDKPVVVVIPEEPKTVAPVPVPREVTAFSEPLTVIDASGNIITSRSKLPPVIGAKVDYRRIARSFTPGQQKNLIYRFQLLPPRVLYVPDNLASTSVRGTYIIFKKKFWYWKEADGLFHLDKTYYQ